jgi:2-polyprenyl-6-methoxyphenol hydroxylase-like FAD-dependent oxidoreductase
MTVEDICNLPPVKLLHGVTGEPLAEMGTDGEPFFRFLHSRLVALLADGVDVRYSKTLDHFSCEKADGSHDGIVTAYFTDGTEVRGRLLIGADGVKSRVRSQLFEHDPKQAALSRLPYAATFVNAAFTADQARYIRAAQGHPFGCVIPHPNGRMNMLCILDAAQAEYPETWRFSFYVGYKCSIEEQDKKATPRERLQEAKQMVKDDGMGNPLKSVYEWVSDDTQTVYYTKVANWDPSLSDHKWDNHEGLVTLAGDACHPMTYRKLIKPDMKCIADPHFDFRQRPR